MLLPSETLLARREGGCNPGLCEDAPAVASAAAAARLLLLLLRLRLHMASAAGCGSSLPRAAAACFSSLQVILRIHAAGRMPVLVAAAAVTPRRRPGPKAAGAPHGLRLLGLRLRRGARRPGGGTASIHSDSGCLGAGLHAVPGWRRPRQRRWPALHMGRLLPCRLHAAQCAIPSTCTAHQASGAAAGVHGERGVVLPQVGGHRRGGLAAAGRMHEHGILQPESNTGAGGIGTRSSLLNC